MLENIIAALKSRDIAKLFSVIESIDIKAFMQSDVSESPQARELRPWIYTFSIKSHQDLEVRQDLKDIYFNKQKLEIHPIHIVYFLQKGERDIANALTAKTQFPIHEFNHFFDLLEFGVSIEHLRAIPFVSNNDMDLLEIARQYPAVASEIAIRSVQNGISKIITDVIESNVVEAYQALFQEWPHTRIEPHMVPNYQVLLQRFPNISIRNSEGDILTLMDYFMNFVILNFWRMLKMMILAIYLLQL